VKLFQIEEPDGTPTDPALTGVAVGVDIGGAEAAVAVAVGGNAVVLEDRDGFALDLAVPPASGPDEAWQRLFESARLRAERALAQPVTHVVIAVTAAPDAGTAAGLLAACEAAGLTVLHILTQAETAASEMPVLAAAVLAEDMAPRPMAP
jgi:molecular chaperone DnaK (HSP70)